MPARPGTIGPPTTAPACAHPSGRTIGAASRPLFPTSQPPEPEPTDLVCHVLDGRSGSSEISNPGPLTSGGKAPDVTRTPCQTSTGGMKTGPPRSALVTSTPSTRKLVCAQDVSNTPSLPTSAG